MGGIAKQPETINVDSAYFFLFRTVVYDAMQHILACDLAVFINTNVCMYWCFGIALHVCGAMDWIGAKPLNKQKRDDFILCNLIPTTI